MTTKYKSGYWLNKNSRDFLKKKYLKSGQTAEQRYRDIANNVEKISKIDGISNKVYEYLMLGWLSLSSPMISNFGNEKGLPIACNGSKFLDSMADIVFKNGEVSIMTKNGAGTSGEFGRIRPRGSPISSGGYSDGVMNFLQMLNTTISVTAQGTTRRGAFASYLPSSHKDIMDYLDIRSEGHIIQDISPAVTFTDDFMSKVEAAVESLDNGVDPEGNEIDIWLKWLQRRSEKGYPFGMFLGNVNANGPKIYRDKGMYIEASNLCTEITQPTTKDESFVCCLLSLNLLHYDDWKDSDIYEVANIILDCAITEYIEKIDMLPDLDRMFMQSSRNFAARHRAIGVGSLGWQSYLQRNNIAFSSFEAKLLNTTIWKKINAGLFASSRKLAEMWGEPELMKGTGLRNATLMAVAPTMSSSFILGQVSPANEPYGKNYEIADRAANKYEFKNPFLKELLASKGKDTFEVWESIGESGGSVQHLDFLTNHEKEVFKIFEEISPYEVIIQAAARQKYIDQAQSLNLVIAEATVRELHDIYMFAYKNGIKTVYYQHGVNPSQKLMQDMSICEACEA